MNSNNYFLFKRSILFLLCLWQAIFPCSAGNFPSAAGARSAAVSGLSVVLEDYWSAQNNPAGLGSISRWSFGLTAEQKFLIKELSSYTLVAALAAGSGSFGLNFNYLGWSAYKEMQAGFSYGRKFSKSFQAGLRLNYLSSVVSETGTRDQWLSFDLGLLLHLNKKISFGLEADNPILTSLKSRDAMELPARFSTGIRYTYSANLMVMAGIQKESGFDLSYQAALEYEILDKFAARLGIRMFPFSLSFGAGIKFNLIQLDISACQHQYLGYTPQISLIFLPGHSKSKK